MWDKKIVVTHHAQQRFEQRNIKYFKSRGQGVEQIKYDLRALNIRTREKLNDNEYKVTTRQGKVYVIIEDEKHCYIKTVYKVNLSCM